MRPDCAFHLTAAGLHHQPLSTIFYSLITIFLLLILLALAVAAFNSIVFGRRTTYYLPITQSSPTSLPCHCNHIDDVADLRDKLDLAKAELKDSSAEIDLYILDLDAMRTQLAAETARADMASSKSDVVSDKLFGLQRTLIAANATVAAQKCEAADTSKELAASRLKLDTMQIEVADCRKQLTSARSDLECLSATVPTIRKELGLARAEAATAREAATSTEELVAATRMELITARADAEDVVLQLKDAHATINKLEARNEATSARLKQVRQELSNMKADSGVLLRSYDAADAAAFVMAHAVRVAELAQLREKEATFDNFKSIFAQKSMSEAQARNQVIALEEKLSKLQDKYDQLSKHHMKVFLEQASMQMENDKLRAKEMEIELDNAKLTRTIAERDTLQKTVDQLAAEAAVNKEKNEHALAVQKARVSEAEKETSRQINLVIAERDRAQSEAYDLSVQNKTLQSTAASLRCEMSTLQDKLRVSEAARAIATQQAECAALERSLSRPLARIEAIALQDTLDKRDAEIEDLLEQMNSSRSPTPENSPVRAAARSSYQPLTPASSLELIDDRPLPTPPITPAGGLLLRSPERDHLRAPQEAGSDEPVSPPRPVTPSVTTPMRIPVRIGVSQPRPSYIADLFSSIPQAPVGPPSPVPRSSTVKPSHLGQSRLPRLSGTPSQNASSPVVRSPASVPLPASPAAGGSSGTPVTRRSPRAAPKRSNETEALHATPRRSGLPPPRPAVSATSSPAVKSSPSSGLKKGYKQSPKAPQSIGPKKGLKER